MENKPTIREEWIEFALKCKDEARNGSGGDGRSGEIAVLNRFADFFLNKIKEVVGTDVPIQTNNGMEVELKWANHVVNFERQRILKEFGIIK